MFTFKHSWNELAWPEMVSSTPSPGASLCPDFIFITGQMDKDLSGLQFPNVDEAVTHALGRTSDVLGRTLRSTANTYLTIEVTSGERSLCVVRATVTIERR